MAPSITAAITHPQDTLSHKLRKPLVEKLRRERINSSIEQLKSLLGPQFLKQQPDSKLEKADILEMTVYFLTQLQRQSRAVGSVTVGQGYSRCVQEVAHFLSKEEVKTQSQRRELKQLQQQLGERDFSPLSSTVHSSSSSSSSSLTKEQSGASSALWRPW